MHTFRLLTDLVTAADKAFAAEKGATLTPEFMSGDRHALELLLALRRAHGPDVIRWEPETVWHFHDFSWMNRDKLQAAFTLATHPTMFIEPQIGRAHV